MSKKFDLLTSVAVAALMVSASSVFAQTITVNGNISQEATNHSGNAVQNAGNISNGGALSGIGLSESITSSGAVAGVTVTTLGTTAPSVSVWGTIDQDASNHGNITNNGKIEPSSGNVYLGLNYNPNVGMRLNGASLNVSASGATTAVGYTSVNNTNNSRPDVSINRIDQASSNYGSIDNDGGISIGYINGAGSSASIGASGSTSYAGLSIVNGVAPIVSINHSGTGIKQNSNNVGTVSNDGKIHIGNVVGDGASVGVSASGSTSAIGLTTINANTSGLTVNGSIDQNATNHGGATVTNNGIIWGGNLDGHGAAASVSASGATTAVSFTTIKNQNLNSITFSTGAIDQDSFNHAKVTNDGSIHYFGNILGQYDGSHGASLSVSAVGASSVIGGTSIGGTAPAIEIKGAINQDAKNTADVTNRGKIGTGGLYGLPGSVSGDGASLSISASGATTAVGYTSIGNNNIANLQINTKAINQHSENSGTVINRQKNGDPNTINVGSINGKGASASIAASGATTAIGVTSINDAKLASVTTGPINQTAVNNGPVTNKGTITVGGAGLSGTGLSLSIGASGATAVASVSFMK